MRLIFIVSIFFYIPALAQWEYGSAYCQNLSSSYGGIPVTSTITTNFNGQPMAFDDDISSVQDIGFPFHFNGQVFTKFILSSNGFIKLGNIPPSPTNYDILHSPDSNIIAAFNTDLEGSNLPGFIPRYSLSLSPGGSNRVNIIQFAGLRDKSFNNRQFDNLEFRIHLIENGSRIVIRCSTFVSSSNPPDQLPVTIGIKGSDAFSSVNVIKTLWEPWSSATFADGPFAGSFGCDNSILPDRGRTFIFNQHSVVPLNLISFTGKKISNSNLLEWSTSSETNTRQFVIERSGDGVSFDDIGSVMAAGNSTTLRQYRYTDHQPTGMDFYRLRMIDRDGSYTYSAIISVRNTEVNTLQVYPNPVKESIHLKLRHHRDEPAEFKIYSAAGLLVEKRRLLLTRGWNVFRINAKVLAKGIYILRIEAGDVVMSEELIKL